MELIYLCVGTVFNDGDDESRLEDDEDRINNRYYCFNCELTSCLILKPAYVELHSLSAP